MLETKKFTALSKKQTSWNRNLVHLLSLSARAMQTPEEIIHD